MRSAFSRVGAFRKGLIPGLSLSPAPFRRVATVRPDYVPARGADRQPLSGSRQASVAEPELPAHALTGREEPLHQFLKQHPELLYPTVEKCWSKLPFGNHSSDFVFREPYNEYLLVEIEAPVRELHPPGKPSVDRGEPQH